MLIRKKNRLDAKYFKNGPTAPPSLYSSMVYLSGTNSAKQAFTRELTPVHNSIDTNDGYLVSESRETLRLFLRLENCYGISLCNSLPVKDIVEFGSICCSFTDSDRGD